MISRANQEYIRNTPSVVFWVRFHKSRKSHRIVNQTSFLSVCIRVDTFPGWWQQSTWFTKFVIFEFLSWVQGQDYFRNQTILWDIHPHFLHIPHFSRNGGSISFRSSFPMVQSRKTPPKKSFIISEGRLFRFKYSLLQVSVWMRTPSTSKRICVLVLIIIQKMK